MGGLAAPDVRWVGAGQVWHNDAVGCPACGGRIVFDADGGWACDRCDFARPDRGGLAGGPELVLADGGRLAMSTSVCPGQFNRANAAMVAVAAPVMCDDPDGPITAVDGPITASTADRPALGAGLAAVDEVAGRFSSMVRQGPSGPAPAGQEPGRLDGHLRSAGRGRAAPAAPVVLSVNARTADGLDTSWLWDVPFERLAGRPVVATGDRRLDLAVRLRYAEVDTPWWPTRWSPCDRAVVATVRAGRP